MVKSPPGARTATTCGFLNSSALAGTAAARHAALIRGRPGRMVTSGPPEHSPPRARPPSCTRAVSPALVPADAALVGSGGLRARPLLNLRVHERSSRPAHRRLHDE